MPKAFRLIFQPVQKFIQKEYASAIFLLAFIVFAIILSNSPLKSLYHKLWEIEFYIGLDKFILNKPLHHWINDGLMSVFFFVIGLELKREIIAGELSSFKKAALPMIGGFGGMLIPAVIYTILNFGKDTSSGWGVPMATDIAIALGILTLAGKKVPLSLKIFLTALAVVDDLGAVLVIALFYSSNISVSDLAIGFGFLSLLFGANIIGIRSSIFYAILGIAGLWYSFQASGIHPSIGGVLVAFTIPARTKINEVAFLNSIRVMADKFEEEVPTNSTLTTNRQHAIIQEIKKQSAAAETPLQKLELALHPIVAFFILPVFAFANSGVEISLRIFGDFFNSVTFGTFAGLVLGKVIGITSFTWFAVKLKFAYLPENISWRHIAGVGLLGGVGFTMSIFIADLAFNEKELIDKAKLGILIASAVSGCAGLWLLRK